MSDLSRRNVSSFWNTKRDSSWNIFLSTKFGLIETKCEQFLGHKKLRELEHFLCKNDQMYENHVFRPFGAHWLRNLHSRETLLTITASTSTFSNVAIAGKAQFPKCPNVAVAARLEHQPEKICHFC